MKFKGIMPALVTPLTADGKVNTDAAEKLIEKLISEGADGFYIGGATGEGICMTPEEREVLAECTVAAVGGRAGTIIHIASTVFEDAVRLARHAERIGADAISAIPPLFYPYSADEIAEYYKKLACAVNIPLIIYNNPGAGVSFTPEQIVSLFEVDNITGIKWTRPDYYSVMRIRDLTHGEMNIINGPDETLLQGLSAGADGGIGTTYNLMTPLYKRIYSLFGEGKMSEALKLQTVADRVVALIAAHGTIPCTKALLECDGIDVGDAGFPFRVMSREEKSAVYEEFRRIYVF